MADEEYNNLSYADHIKSRHHKKGWIYACLFTVCCCFCCYEACECCLKVFSCCNEDSEDKEE